MHQKLKTNDQTHMRDITNAIGFCHIACSIRPIQRTEPGQSKTSQDAFETGHDARKTGRIVVDYNGAKVPWAPKAWVHTPDGTLRGADIVWDTYPSLDVQQRPPESNPQYESSIDRYS